MLYITNFSCKITDFTKLQLFDKKSPKLKNLCRTACFCFQFNLTASAVSYKRGNTYVLCCFYPMACFSSSLCTGTDSFPRNLLMMGRLLANLSFTSISRTSVGRDTKLNLCRDTGNIWNDRMIETFLSTARAEPATRASADPQESSFWTLTGTL